MWVLFNRGVSSTHRECIPTPVHILSRRQILESLGRPSFSDDAFLWSYVTVGMFTYA